MGSDPITEMLHKKGDREPPPVSFRIVLFTIMKSTENVKNRQNTATIPSVMIRLLLTVLVIVPAAAGLAGCAKKTSNDVRIELEALDGEDISSSDAVFPTFVSKDEVFQKELDKLNKETEKIRKNYEDRRQKDKEFIVHTYVSDVKAVPQCTLFWYEEHSLLGDDYNLMTLAYNKKTEALMTSKEALDSLDIDGVALSTNVGKRFKELQPSLEVKKTEMQGFETDESGAVTRIYMKLVAEKIPADGEPENEDAEQEIHFYYYDLKEEILRPISELGYEIP